MARHGTARNMACSGKAWRGEARNKVRLGMARLGKERGPARHGTAGQGKARPGEEQGRVDLSGNKYKYGLRAVRRSASIALRTDRSTLKKEEEAVLDHIIRVSATIQTVAATEARKLTYPFGDK